MCFAHATVNMPAKKFLMDALFTRTPVFSKAISDRKSLRFFQSFIPDSSRPIKLFLSKILKFLPVNYAIFDRGVNFS